MKRDRDNFDINQNQVAGVISCFTDIVRIAPSVLGAIQVIRNANGGGGGCQMFREKALQRYKVQRY